VLGSLTSSLSLHHSVCTSDPSQAFGANSYNLAGLVMALMNKMDSPAVKIYQITYLVGIGLGTILYMAVNTIFPPLGLGVDEPFDAIEVLEGLENSHDVDTGSETPDKAQPNLSESQVSPDTKV